MKKTILSYLLVLAFFSPSAKAQTVTASADAPIVTNRDVHTQIFLDPAALRKLSQQLKIQHKDDERVNPDQSNDGTTKPGNDPGNDERVNPKPDDDKPESAPSSPPLLGEDADTVGKGMTEVNFYLDCDHTRADSSCAQMGDITYGLTDRLDVNIVKGISRETSPGEPATYSATPTELGFKVKMFDRNNWQISVAPTVTFNATQPVTNVDGTVTPGTGKTVLIPIIVSKEFKNFTTTANVGFQNTPGGEKSMVTSFAVGHAIDDKSRIMGEVYSERDMQFRNRETDVTIGYVRTVVNNPNKNYQISVFAAAGTSIGHTEDGLRHKQVRFGISVAFGRH